jgi:hypothetical protein
MTKGERICVAIILAGYGYLILRVVAHYLL